MKHIRNTFVRIVLFSMCGILFLSDYAQSFRDDFDVLKEKNWEHWGEYAIWKVEDGFLKVWIQSPRAGRDFTPTIELLQFKDLSGSYEHFDKISGEELIQRDIKQPGYETFTITLNNIGDKDSDFGIAIGRRFPELRGDWPFFYLFVTNTSYSVRFNVWNWGGAASGKATGRMPHNPDTIWKDKELETMKLHFNKGHIQWFVDGEKRADFADPEFATVEILGFVVIGSGQRVEHGWVDSFKISGPGLSVSPQKKLATTWGTLKQLR